MPQSPPSDMLFPIGPHSLILSNNSTLWWPNIQISEPIGDILIQTTKPTESSDQLLPTYLKQRVFCQFSSEYRQKDFWRIFKFCSWIVHTQRNLWGKKSIWQHLNNLCAFSLSFLGTDTLSECVWRNFPTPGKLYWMMNPPHPDGWSSCPWEHLNCLTASSYSSHCLLPWSI